MIHPPNESAGVIKKSEEKAKERKFPHLSLDSGGATGKPAAPRAGEGIFSSGAAEEEQHLGKDSRMFSPTPRASPHPVSSQPARDARELPQRGGSGIPPWVKNSPSQPLPAPPQSRKTPQEPQIPRQQPRVRSPRWHRQDLAWQRRRAPELSRPSSCCLQLITPF